MSATFGPIRQNGYVVRDIQAAMAHWSKVMGVGPFFFVEEVPVSRFEYNGISSDLKMSIALANSVDLQIELIEQHNDAPSMYLDFLEDNPKGGLQHVAFWTQDFDEDFERAISEGLTVGQRGQIGRDGRFVYFRSEGPTGTVIELSEISGRKGKLFEEIRQASLSWDGLSRVKALT
jgi:hypothetical protein